MPLLTATNLSKAFGANDIFAGLTFSIPERARIAIVGPNGIGKTTLLRILAGLEEPSSGSVHRARGLRLGYLPQEATQISGGTLWEYCLQAFEPLLAQAEQLKAFEQTMQSHEADAKLVEQYGSVLSRFEQAGGYTYPTRIKQTLAGLGSEAGDYERPLAPLSGGQRPRAMLARLLLESPDLLLLDEPTNHLDAETVAWLEEYLKKFSGTLVVVTHDRYFLNNMTEWILEMDAGRGYPFKGNYEKWLEAKQAMAAAQNKQHASRQKMLQRELEWIRLNPSGRQSKNKARLARYEELAAQQVDTREDVLEIQIPSGKRLGDLVVRAQDVRKVYGNRLIMDGVTFDLPRGGIVGVIGPNGAGKTTLLRMIVGEEKPDGGTLTIGETVELSYVNQFRDTLDSSRTVYEEITGGQETLDLGGKPMNGRAYCTRFNFRGADQQKKVGELSGGERNRVHLAKLLRRGGNVLLLDEPTNDLDVTTLRALEEGIQSFGGCAVVVSHDRWFLDRIATHILAFEDDGTVTWFEGNFEGSHEQRRRLLGDAADQPRRIRFRPI